MGAKQRGFFQNGAPHDLSNRPPSVLIGIFLLDETDGQDGPDIERFAHAFSGVYSLDKEIKNPVTPLCTHEILGDFNWCANGILTRHLVRLTNFGILLSFPGQFLLVASRFYDTIFYQQIL